MTHARALKHSSVQGLFVRHQLMFAAQLCMMVLQKKDALPGPKLEFLLRGPRKASCPANPVPEWLPNSCWAILQCLQVRLTSSSCVYNAGAARQALISAFWHTTVPAGWLCSSMPTTTKILVCWELCRAQAHTRLRQVSSAARSSLLHAFCNCTPQQERHADMLLACRSWMSTGPCQMTWCPVPRGGWNGWLWSDLRTSHCLVSSFKALLPPPSAGRARPLTPD